MDIFSSAQAPSRHGPVSANVLTCGPVIAGQWTALPEHAYPQQAITEALVSVTGADRPTAAVIERIHRNSGVATRHLALPLTSYPQLDGFTDANNAFSQHAVALAARAAEGALAAAGVRGDAVDVVISTTVTGVVVPSLEARLVPRLGMSGDVKRLPLMGLGCVAGAGGIARARDYLLGHPTECVLLVSAELCSLTIQRTDLSMPNLVASGLFGDGAAAVVLLGAEYPESTPDGFRVVANRSVFYPDTERAMGWDVSASGLKIVLGVEVPELVRTNLHADVMSFLGDVGLDLGDVSFWVTHPGGPKVLEAVQDALQLPGEALSVTWESLREIGNVSSVSVLDVLGRTLRRHRPPAGSYGLMLAMGPGFCAELVLLHTPEPPG